MLTVAQISPSPEHHTPNWFSLLSRLSIKETLHYPYPTKWAKPLQKTSSSKRTISPKTTATTTTTAGEDRLSALPDSLLLSILSLVPTKDAISTSVLSTRWQHLYTQLSHLSFSGPYCPEDPHKDQPAEYLSKYDNFLNTISNILNSLTSPKLHKFELFLDLPVNRDFNRCDSLVDSCVRRVCSLRPEDISVIPHSFSYWKHQPVKIPASILQCDTIVSLNLSGGFVYEISNGNYNFNEINLPNLKKLGMFLRAAHEKLLTALLNSCPLLAELCLTTPFYEPVHVVEISSPNLKRLNISGHMFSLSGEFVIDAPKLEDLSISSSATRYPFVRRPSGLIKADISMSDQWNNPKKVHEDIVEVLCAVSTVNFLKIAGGMLSAIGRFKDEALSVFHNLSKLSVQEFSHWWLNGLFVLLNCCPNMEVLELCMTALDNGIEIGKNWTPPFQPPCLVTKLKVLEFYHCGFIEYMLRNGDVLDKLHVHISYYDADDQLHKELEFYRKMLSYPRSSLACEIQCSSPCFNASSKSFKDGPFNSQISRRDFESGYCSM